MSFSLEIEFDLAVKWGVVEVEIRLDKRHDNNKNFLHKNHLLHCLGKFLVVAILLVKKRRQTSIWKCMSGQFMARVSFCRDTSSRGLFAFFIISTFCTTTFTGNRLSLHYRQFSCVDNFFGFYVY